jgi:hypothetical protein
VQRTKSFAGVQGVPEKPLFPLFAAGAGERGRDSLLKTPLKLLNVLLHWLYKYVMLNKENIIWLYVLITL